MIDLSVPLHIDWMGGLKPADYLDRLQSYGVTAVEAQLPPDLSALDLKRWTTLIAMARERQLSLAIHVPIALSAPIWQDLYTWLAQAATAPLTLVVHGHTAGRPDAGLVAQTVSHVRVLLASLPPVVNVAIEQGWNWGMMIGPGAAIRSLRDSRLRRRMERRRPAGVGSAMGAELPPAIQPGAPTATDFDPPLRASWWRTFRRTDGFSGTGTREETLQVVMEVNRPNCVIAWDLAHDWLGGAKGGVADWRSTPTSDFLDRVGYVRLHDVDAKGCDHWPLVMGNVPYASQLRALLRHGFAGTVCLAVRYTQHMAIFGDRWHVLERSLAITRQVLRLN